MACCTALSPSSLPSGIIGQTYSQQITATCGEPTPAYTITLNSGSLPTGLTLSQVAGNPATISGTLTEAGTFTFTLRLKSNSIDPGCVDVLVQYIIIIRRKRGGRVSGILLPAEMIKVQKIYFPKGAPSTYPFEGGIYYYSHEDNIYYYYKKKPTVPPSGERTQWQLGVSGTVIK